METKAPAPKKAKAKTAKAKAPAKKAKKAKPTAKKSRLPGIPYSPEIAVKICAAIAECKSLRTIERMAGMPSAHAMTTWQQAHPEFALMLDRPRELRADRRVEAISDLAKRVEEGKLDPNAGRVSIDALKWLASRENFRRWGDEAAMVVANVSPAAATDNGASPACEALLAKLKRIADNQRWHDPGAGPSVRGSGAAELGRCGR